LSAAFSWPSITGVALLLSSDMLFTTTGSVSGHPMIPPRVEVGLNRYDCKWPARVSRCLSFPSYVFPLFGIENLKLIKWSRRSEDEDPCSIMLSDRHRAEDCSEAQ